MTDLELLWTQIDKGKNGENIGISTGIPKLDKLIGGIQPSRYYTIAAASSVGKSALILLLNGGVVYTIGAVLYGLGKRKKYFHSIFHFFVLAGAILMFVSVYCFVL